MIAKAHEVINLVDALGAMPDAQSCPVQGLP